jgi:hypothetical protein
MWEGVAPKEPPGSKISKLAHHYERGIVVKPCSPPSEPRQRELT